MIGVDCYSCFFGRPFLLRKPSNVLAAEIAADDRSSYSPSSLSLSGSGFSSFLMGILMPWSANFLLR